MTDAPERPPEVPGSEAGVVAVLELLEEQAVVSRRVMAGATVRITTTTSVREQQIDEALSRETVEIERVPVGRVVEATPDIRQAGDVTIVPVMEEVLVVERRLVLKEEVRIRRVRTAEAHREMVQLRFQEATVTRSDAGCTTVAAKPPNLEASTTEKDQP